MPGRRWLLVSIVTLAACSAASQKGDGATDGGAEDASLFEVADGAADWVTSCMVAAPTSCPSPAPRFADIKPVVDRWCVICHDGFDPEGPWPLTDYEHVASWADTIRPALLGCEMPPVDAGLAMPMPAEDRLLILNWLRCGFPR